MNVMAEVSPVAVEHGLEVLGAAQAESIVADLADRFVLDRTNQWWWTVPTGPVRRVSYGDDDALLLLEAEIGPATVVYLIVTDESAQPAGVVSGMLSLVLGMLRNCRVFEFALTDHDVSWAVFDTHHSELVWLGTMADR